MSDFGLSDQGYTAPRQADYLAQFRQAYEARLVAAGETTMPDWERDLLVSQVSEFVSFALAQQSEANQAVYDARSEANATGLQLANLTLIAGVERQEATQGTVLLHCTGVEGTIITQGKICEGGGADGSARWICTEDGAIGASGVDLVFKCEDEGQIIASPGDIDTIVTTIDGWTGVTNAAAASPGQNRETDAELKIRKRRAPQAQGGTNTNAILATLLELDFVTGCVVIDNKTLVEAVVDGITLLACSTACVVAPNTMTDEQKNTVVRTIFTKLGSGTDTSGDESATVTKPDGRSETIRYSFAVDSTITLAWELVLKPGYSLADVTEPLALLVEQLFETFTAGETVYPLPLLALAAAVDGIADVASLLINADTLPVTHDATERPVLGSNNMVEAS